jgi:hypothetical protein
MRTSFKKTETLRPAAACGSVGSQTSSHTMNPNSYRSYRDLPPLAGIATIPEAMRIGLSVDDCVSRLKRHHWAFRRLNEIFLKRLISEPIYELKMGLACTPSIAPSMRRRGGSVWRKCANLRSGLDVVPDAALDTFSTRFSPRPARKP